MLTVVACLQLLGVIKTIVGCLDKHRDLKDNQELRAELNKVCLLQEATPSGLGEVVVSSTIQKFKQRIKQNEETERICPKKEYKTQKNLNERNINLPDKELNSNAYEDAH